APAVQLEQLLMGLAPAQQRLERLVGGLVGLVALEDLGVGLLGLLRLLQIVALHRAELEQQVAAQVGLGALERAALGLGLGGLPGDAIECALVGGRDHAHRDEAATEPLQQLAALPVGRIELEQLGVDVERLAAALGHLLVDRRELGLLLAPTLARRDL